MIGRVRAWLRSLIQRRPDRPNATEYLRRKALARAGNGWRAPVLVAGVLALTGCGGAGPLERAEIVAVQCEERGGRADCETVIQFESDSTRWARSEKWGEVGDVFYARRDERSGRDYWRSSP